MITKQQLEELSDFRSISNRVKNINNILENLRKIPCSRHKGKTIISISVTGDGFCEDCHAECWTLSSGKNNE